MFVGVYIRMYVRMFAPGCQLQLNIIVICAFAIVNSTSFCFGIFALIFYSDFATC